MLPKIETPRPSRHLVLYTSAAAILFFFFFFFFFLFLFFLGGGSNHNSIKNDEGFGLDEIKKYIPDASSSERWHISHKFPASLSIYNDRLWGQDIVKIAGIHMLVIKRPI